jgi:hypothetical protein
MIYIICFVLFYLSFKICLSLLLFIWNKKIEIKESTKINCLLYISIPNHNILYIKNIIILMLYVCIRFQHFPFFRIWIHTLLFSAFAFFFSSSSMHILHETYCNSIFFCPIFYVRPLNSVINILAR